MSVRAPEDLARCAGKHEVAVFCALDCFGDLALEIGPTAGGFGDLFRI
jgi:hypothetical protein